MEKKKQYKRLTQKLSSRNIAIVLAINALLSFLLVFLAGRLYRGRFGSLPFLAEYEKTLYLVLLFGMICSTVLNIAFLYNPQTRLEQMVACFQKTGKLPPGFNIENASSALEKTFFDILQQQKEAMEREYRNEMLRQQSELMALQSQINPHFLYNTLDSIRGMAILRQADDIADMTEALSRLFRSMIAKAGKMILLSEELEAVTSYMLIQQFRFNNRFDYEIKLDSPYLAQAEVPNMIIQPIVENAIIHGLEPKEKDGKIILSVYATEKRLVINVEDNGIGIPANKLELINEKLQGKQNREKQDPLGIAMANINQRIMLQFGEEYGINIMSTPQVSTVVELVLPLFYREEAHTLGS